MEAVKARHLMASKQFDGIKIRITNGLSAGGSLLPAWVQVLGFSEAEMPLDKVPSGVLVMKLPRLSYISNERRKIAKIDDDRDAVPDFLHAVISTDGGMTQMMALGCAF